jgi:hypothetical protein
MKFEKLVNISNNQFRRITGVKRTTFDKMVEEVQKADTLKKARGGRPNKLIIEDRVLMALEYLREYRTYLNIGTSYGISESNAFANIKFVEDTLVKSTLFRLPGKKVLRQDTTNYDVVLIDATETPIERPKKNNVNIIQVRKNVIP